MLSRWRYQTQQVLEAESVYRNKALVMQGALDEARRECLSLQASYAAKENILREELITKDKRLIHIQSSLDSLNEVTDSREVEQC